MPQIIPIRNLKNTAEISEMCHLTKEPIFVTKNGYGDMVIMSMEAYEEKIALLDMLLKIKKAENDAENNRVSDAFTSLKIIREKYNV
ncbi:MAG: type II toxin-antitoxin system Phd/YefM family antitoxin [Clostridia bacterium]|nr:type II toxin-antitoxin system Phd/YefM family antitoxin [Clostridia bacterium]